jgi:AcrR family transcriptional regulator
MSTLTRKQREIQERERLFLRIARKMLIEQGYAGLSMDRLAEATEYSKGTVYQHFQTKEDLVAALLIESNEQSLALFDKARRFQGRARERMLAMGFAHELFARLHPHHFRSEQIVRLANLEIRASAERRETLLKQDACCTDWCAEIVQAGIDEGDLILAPGQTVGEIVFAILAMAIGTYTTMLSYSHLIDADQVASPFESLRRNVHFLFDGYGWRPLRAKWDYAGTSQRILKEIFADEAKRAGLLGS